MKYYVHKVDINVLDGKTGLDGRSREVISRLDVPEQDARECGCEVYDSLADARESHPTLELWGE